MISEPTTAISSANSPSVPAAAEEGRAHGVIADETSSAAAKQRPGVPVSAGRSFVQLFHYDVPCFLIFIFVQPFMHLNYYFSQHRRSSIDIKEVRKSREVTSLPQELQDDIGETLVGNDKNSDGRIDPSKFASVVSHMALKIQTSERAAAETKLKAQEAEHKAIMERKHVRRLRLGIAGLCLAMVSLVAATFGINVAADNATKEMMVADNGELRTMSGAEVKTRPAIVEIKPVEPAGEDASARFRRLQNLHQICSNNYQRRAHLLQDGSGNTEASGTSLGCFDEDAVGAMELSDGSTIKIQTSTGENYITWCII